MYLKYLQLVNFKNHETAEFTFSPKVNGIVGENGCGKTNLLDAIHYLSFCKSYFSPQDSFSVRFGADFFALHGDFYSFETQNSNRVSCTFKIAGRKTVKLNQKEYDRLSDHIGIYPLVMVSPYDNDIINEGSEVRRRFFDMIISQFDREYLHQLVSYQKLMVQRNRLLKQFIETGTFDHSLLQIFDEQMAPLARYIYQKRTSFVGDILPDFQSYYDFLSDSREKVDIIYQSGLNELSYEKGMATQACADRKSGYTNFGIHKDDFVFTINENSIKRFGSQGQQKSFALALKLAQFDYVYDQKGVKPILLLDDIFDKLDRRRIAHLLDLVGKDHFGQVFISDTDERRIADILENHHIENVIFPLSKH